MHRRKSCLHTYTNNARLFIKPGVDTAPSIDLVTLICERCAPFSKSRCMREWEYVHIDINNAHLVVSPSVDAIDRITHNCERCAPFGKSHCLWPNINKCLHTYNHSAHVSLVHDRGIGVEYKKCARIIKSFCCISASLDGKCYINSTMNWTITWLLSGILFICGPSSIICARA